MVSLSPDAGFQTLAASLRSAVEKLDQLRSCTRLFPGSNSWVSRRLPAFSLPALDRLGAVVQEGCEAIGRRVQELGAPADESPQATEAKQRRSKGEPTVADPQTLMLAYRASARALCAALMEARRIGDSASAALLAALVHRLEKQLWLLDASRVPEGFGRRAVNLFLLC